jgi:DnaJ-domain-containing protein 1
MPGTTLGAEKKRSLWHFVLGMLVVLLGVRLVGTSWALVAFPVVVVGVYHASQAFSRLARIQAIERDIYAQARADFARQFRRSTLPRQVYWLLLAIADADGTAGEKETRLVRDFLLERFPPQDLHEIASWHQQRAGVDQIHGLAAGLRATLTRSETETLFFWACLVAFADHGFNDAEHDALQQAARGLGLPDVHARRIFWHAKHAFLGTGSRGSSRNGGSRNAGRERGPRPAPSTTARQTALAILGLDETASADDIRRRHRELVKKFHPDRHSHLGEAAAREAAARFREVQVAYERLRG